MKLKQKPRSGAALIEGAFVFPVLVFFILALVVGATAIFRFQEVNYAAHEGARWASVHGTDYATEQKKSAATAQDVYNNAIQPRFMTVDPAYVTYNVTWNQNNSPSSVGTSYEKPVRNAVTVTVTYTWFPEMYLVGPITLTGTSTVPMTY
jgi:Flp pilus assembly protein TadG